MRRHESHAEIAFYARNLFKKARETVFKTEIFAVRIDVLSQQGYLFITLVDKSLKFVRDRGHGAAAFSSAHIGHDAISAEIIAAVHDIQPGVGATRAENGSIFAYRRLFVFQYGENAATLIFDRIDIFG